LGESSLYGYYAGLDAAGAIKPMSLKAADLTNHVKANRLQLTEPQPATIMHALAYCDHKARASAILPLYPSRPCHQEPTPNGR